MQIKANQDLQPNDLVNVIAGQNEALVDKVQITQNFNSQWLLQPQLDSDPVHDRNYHITGMTSDQNGNTYLIGHQSTGMILNDEQLGRSTIDYDFVDISETGTDVPTNDEIVEIPIGFTFNYFGVDYQNCNIMNDKFLNSEQTVTRGFITFGTDIGNEDSFFFDTDKDIFFRVQADGLREQDYSNIPKSVIGYSVNNPRIFARENSIYALSSTLMRIDENTRYIYQTIGQPGDQILIIQWENMVYLPVGNTPFGQVTGDSVPITFQLKLFEGANRAEVHIKNFDTYVPIWNPEIFPSNAKFGYANNRSFYRINQVIGYTGNDPENTIGDQYLENTLSSIPIKGVQANELSEIPNPNIRLYGDEPIIKSETAFDILKLSTASGFLSIIDQNGTPQKLVRLANFVAGGFDPKWYQPVWIRLDNDNFVYICFYLISHYQTTSIATGAQNRAVERTTYRIVKFNPEVTEVIWSKAIGVKSESNLFTTASFRIQQLSRMNKFNNYDPTYNDRFPRHLITSFNIDSESSSLVVAGYYEFSIIFGTNDNLTPFETFESPGRKTFVARLDINTGDWTWATDGGNNINTLMPFLDTYGVFKGFHTGGVDLKIDQNNQNQNNQNSKIYLTGNLQPIQKDNFGYTVESIESDLIDILNIRNHLDFLFEKVRKVPIGFDFQFYGETYSECNVFADGILGFGDDYNYYDSFLKKIELDKIDSSTSVLYKYSISKLPSKTDVQGADIPACICFGPFTWDFFAIDAFASQVNSRGIQFDPDVEELGEIIPYDFEDISESENAILLNPWPYDFYIEEPISFADHDFVYKLFGQEIVNFTPNPLGRIKFGNNNINEVPPRTGEAGIICPEVNATNNHVNVVHPYIKVDNDFEDISETGTRITSIDGGEFGPYNRLSDPIPLQFSIDFYGINVSEFKVAENGWMTFDTEYTNGMVPYKMCPSNEIPDMFLTAGWQNSNIFTGLGLGAYFELKENPTRMIVQWRDRIQIKIFDTGVIQYHYVFDQSVLLGENGGSPAVGFQVDRFTGGHFWIGTETHPSNFQTANFFYAYQLPPVARNASEFGKMQYEFKEDENGKYLIVQYTDCPGIRLINLSYVNITNAQDPKSAFKGPYLKADNTYQVKIYADDHLTKPNDVEIHYKLLGSFDPMAIQDELRGFNSAGTFADEYGFNQFEDEDPPYEEVAIKISSPLNLGYNMPNMDGPNVIYPFNGINYATTGEAPNRIFVVDYDTTPIGSNLQATSLQNRIQVQLFETGKIEVHCTGAGQNQRRFIGIQNHLGDDGLVAVNDFVLDNLYEEPYAFKFSTEENPENSLYPSFRQPEPEQPLIIQPSTTSSFTDASDVGIGFTACLNYQTGEWEWVVPEQQQSISTTIAINSMNEIISLGYRMFMDKSEYDLSNSSAQAKHLITLKNSEATPIYETNSFAGANFSLYYQNVSRETASIPVTTSMHHYGVPYMNVFNTAGQKIKSIDLLQSSLSYSPYLKPIYPQNLQTMTSNENNSNYDLIFSSLCHEPFAVSNHSIFTGISNVGDYPLPNNALNNGENINLEYGFGVSQMLDNLQFNQYFRNNQLVNDLFEMKELFLDDNQIEYNFEDIKSTGISYTQNEQGIITWQSAIDLPFPVQIGDKTYQRFAPINTRGIVMFFQDADYIEELDVVFNNYIPPTSTLKIDRITNNSTISPQASDNYFTEPSIVTIPSEHFNTNQVGGDYNETHKTQELRSAMVTPLLATLRDEVIRIKPTFETFIDHDFEDLFDTGDEVELTAVPENRAFFRSEFLDLPFPFVHYGVEYNQYQIDSSGIITFIANQYPLIGDRPLPNKNMSKAAIFCSGLRGNAFVNNDPEFIPPVLIQTQVRGEEPNRRLIIQFGPREFRPPTIEDPVGDPFPLPITNQIKLFETTHKVEWHHSKEYWSMPRNTNYLNIGMQNEDGTVGNHATAGLGNFSVSGIGPGYNGTGIDLNNASIQNILNGVHYQTMGEAPNRYLVIQWTNWLFTRSSFRFANGVNGRYTVQLKIFENGRMESHIKRADNDFNQYRLIGQQDCTGLFGRQAYSGRDTLIEKAFDLSNGSTISISYVDYIVIIPVQAWNELTLHFVNQVSNLNSTWGSKGFRFIVALTQDTQEQQIPNDIPTYLTDFANQYNLNDSDTIYLMDDFQNQQTTGFQFKDNQNPNQIISGCMAFVRRDGMQVMHIESIFTTMPTSTSTPIPDLGRMNTICELLSNNKPHLINRSGSGLFCLNSQTGEIKNLIFNNKIADYKLSKFWHGRIDEFNNFIENGPIQSWASPANTDLFTIKQGQEPESSPAIVYGKNIVGSKWSNDPTVNMEQVNNLTVHTDSPYTLNNDFYLTCLKSSQTVASKYIGNVNQAVQSGQLANVDFLGKVIECNQIELIPGVDYYVNSIGKLTTDNSMGNRFIGVALTSNQLLLNSARGAALPLTP